MWGESSDIERESQRHSSTAQIPGKVFVLPDLPLWPCRTFKVILRTLNWILYLTGSCWRTVEVSVIRCFTGADQQLSRNTLVIKADKKEVLRHDEVKVWIWDTMFLCLEKTRESVTLHVGPEPTCKRWGLKIREEFLKQNTVLGFQRNGRLQHCLQPLFF